MTPVVYRYTFGPDVPHAEVEATMALAVVAAEGLHGEARLRLEVAHTIESLPATAVVEVRGRAGQDLNRLFIGFLTREFGPDGVRIERLPVIKRHRPVPA
jgi:hypothetical protein